MAPICSHWKQSTQEYTTVTQLWFFSHTCQIGSICTLSSQPQLKHLLKASLPGLLSISTIPTSGCSCSDLSIMNYSLILFVINGLCFQVQLEIGMFHGVLWNCCANQSTISLKAIHSGYFNVEHLIHTCQVGAVARKIYFLIQTYTGTVTVRFIIV